MTHRQREIVKALMELAEYLERTKGTLSSISVEDEKIHAAVDHGPPELPVRLTEATWVVSGKCVLGLELFVYNHAPAEADVDLMNGVIRMPERDPVPEEIVELDKRLDAEMWK